MVFSDNRKMIQTPLEYIIQRTMKRPRDIIKYMKLCSSHAQDDNKKLVSADTITHVEKEYSYYLRSELEDEISGILPNIKEIMKIISDFVITKTGANRGNATIRTKGQ